MSNIVLIDSNALAHRAFHAYPPTLTTSKGEATNAIFGYFALVLQTLTTLKPEAIICVFDTPARNFRDELYEQYKANRPTMDQLLVEQMPKIIQILRDAGINTLTLDGFEADDVIGSLTRSSKLKNYQKIVVTGDKDLFQTLNPDTQVYLAGNPFSSSKLYDRTSASEKMGFDIAKIVTYKALKGDPTDNIPGVKGIGEKIATDLVNQYEDLEDIYSHIADIKPAIKEKLMADHKMAELSQKLATIKMDIGVDIDLDKFEVQDIDFASLKNSFQRYELRSLIQKLDKLIPVKSIDQLTTIIDISKYKNVLVDNALQLKQFSEQMMSTQIIALHADSINELFIATDSIVYQIKTKLLNLDLVKQIADKTIYVYDGKNLYHILAELGINTIHLSEDLMLMEHIASMGQTKASLENLIGISKEQASLFEDSPLYQQTAYIYTKTLANMASLTQILPDKMLSLYQNIEKPLIKVLFKIEQNGIKLNATELKDLDIELNEHLERIARDIYKEAGEEFNIASPKQLSHILFEKIGVKGGKKNKSGGFSTNERFLLDHISIPIIQHIILYRELYKLRSTYTNTLIQQIDSNDKRVHSTFNQAIAITGRLSSTDPNLQNIPTNTDWGQRIRKAFVAEKNHLLLSFDYSQQELRLLAEFSHDENLAKAFQEGFDIHAYTASQIFKTSIESVTPAQRRSAKTVNFGVVYGISAFGLSQRLQIPPQEAQAFIDAFYASYPQVKIYFEQSLTQAKRAGFVETLFGRRKNTGLLNSSNYQVRMAMEREIINFPLQGSAAEIMKNAMINSDKIVTEKYADFAIMILQVHDEIIFEVNTSRLDDARLKEFVKEIKTIMSQGLHVKIPMLVEAKVGTSWSELNKLNY